MIPLERHLAHNGLLAVLERCCPLGVKTQTTADFLATSPKTHLLGFTPEPGEGIRV